jgi:hypothetical protein
VAAGLSAIGLVFCCHGGLFNDLQTLETPNPQRLRVWQWGALVGLAAD